MSRKFTVDARSILMLGRDSIKDHTTALIELVKNSYDADATKVEVEVMTECKKPCIRVADNGCGMTEKDVDEHWLRIGYSEKRVHRFSKLKRRRTGEKGIGRISADRLGAALRLQTKVRGKAFALQVNWDRFDVEGKDLTDIPIKEVKKPKISLPTTLKNPKPNSGTELIIRKLRQAWTESDIEDLHRELSLLVPPFMHISDFRIELKTDVARGYSGNVKSEIYKTARIVLRATFNGDGQINYTIKDREDKKGPIKKHKINWPNLMQRVQRTTQTNHKSPKCGPVSLILMFFPRKAEILKGTEFSMRDLRQFLDNNAGVSIYRDKIRVRPYGDPMSSEGDWLGLGPRLARNPAGAGRKSFRISPNQVVGSVFVSRDNNDQLVDSTSREGLIHGEAFHDLQAFVVGCVRLLEVYYHEKFVQEKIAEQAISPSEQVKSLKQSLTYLKRDLRNVAPMMARESETAVARVLESVESVVDKIQETQESISELESQNTTYRGLATIGIAASVFAHETQSAIGGFTDAAYTVRRLLKLTPPKVSEAIEELDVAIKYADQVNAWGAFALRRIQREKRRKTKQDIKDITEEVIHDLKPALDALNISIKTHLRSVNAQTYAMDIEAVLINLLTNAYTACQQVNRARTIKVEVKPKSEGGTDGFEIVVSDSGPGVAKEFIDRIWDPLFSTKTNEDGKQVGTGLGLAIVQSIVNDLKGSRRVDTDPELKGARFLVWLPAK